MPPGSHPRSPQPIRESLGRCAACHDMESISTDEGDALNDLANRYRGMVILVATAKCCPDLISESRDDL